MLIWCLFVSAFAYAGCSQERPRGSLTYIIDNTPSMRPTIEQVKTASQRILNIIFSKSTTSIEDIVLLTFNDPTWRFITKTKNKKEAEKALRGIDIFYDPRNEWCAEYSMQGLEEGLKLSLNNSFVFVFTDAAARDENKWEFVRDLAQEKQTRVMFIISKSVCNVEIVDDYIYYKIAEQTNGQVFRTENVNDIQHLFEYVDVVVDGVSSVLLTMAIPPNTPTDIPFTVDEQTEYVFVSVSGKSKVDLQIIGPITDFEKKTWLENSKMAKLNHPPSGNYIARVTGKSKTSIQVISRTDFTFDFGFSSVPTTSLSNTNKQPVDASNYYLIVSVKDPSQSVKILKAMLQSVDEKPRDLKTLQLTKISGDLYTSEQFMIPSKTDMINIMIEGVGIKTNRVLRRKSKTPVVIRKQSIKPRITFEKSEVKIEYNEDAVLVCNVKAQPKPKITWVDENGRSLSGIEQSNPPYDFSSRVTLRNLKKSQRVRCTAQNEFGTTALDASVEVKSPFVVHEDFTDRSQKVHFGDPVTIKCRIQARHPRYGIDIAWFKQTHKLELITNSVEYQISDDKTKLTIQHVDEQAEGKYVCKAFVVGDETTNHIINTSINIKKVAPKLRQWPPSVSVKENTTMELRCDVIDGYPQAHIRWQTKRDLDSFHDIIGENENLLIIRNMQLKDTEIHFKCLASNEVGNAQQETKVLVTAPPRITTLINVENSGDINHVDYNRQILLRCHASGYPLPAFTWFDGKHELPDEGVVVLNNFNVSSHLRVDHAKRPETYYCKAKNRLGKTESHINIEVNSPFLQNPSFRNVTLTSGYGKPFSFTCQIWSVHGDPLDISWYKVNDGKYSLVGKGRNYRIEKLLLESQGTYVCNATLVEDREMISDEYVVNVKIRGLEKPKFEPGNTNIIAKQNEQVVLSCRILKGHPKPDISWEFKKYGTNAFEQLDNKQLEYKIQKVDLDNAGQYKCKADNGVGQDKRTMQLTVNAPPKIHFDDDKRLYSAVEGDAVLPLHCDVTGYPKSIIIWTVDGLPIKTDEKYNIVDDGATLIIKSPVLNDSNNFTCEAKNEFGVDRARFETAVYPVLVDDEHRGDGEYIYILKGDTMKLECGDENSKKIVWYKEDYPLNKTGKLFTVKKATEIHDGNYTCRVSTDSNVTAHTYKVDVGYKPEFEFNVKSKVNWDRRDYILRCDVKMKPSVKTVEIQWKYNGKILENLSENQKVIGWGDYSCHIKNVHGEVSRTFSVHSSDCSLRRDTQIKNMPVIINTDSNLETVRNFFSFRNKAELKLSCINQTRKLNVFKSFPTKQELVVSCDHEDLFTVAGDNKRYKFENFACNSPVTPTVRKTDIKCLQENSAMFEIGFETDDFMKVYEVCYDTLNENPLYTKVEMSIPSNLPDSSSVFEHEWNVFGVDDGYYNCTGDTNCCYARSQLVNPEDVKFGPPQRATKYIRLNTVPLWRDCAEEKVGWDAVEKSLRSILLDADKMTVWTGASEYKSRGTARNSRVQDISRFLWKVVKTENYLETFAVVYVNDPLRSSEDVRCSDFACPPELPNSEYTYCCKLSDFSSAFGFPENIFE